MGCSIKVSSDDVPKSRTQFTMESNCFTLVPDGSDNCLLLMARLLALGLVLLMLKTRTMLQ